MRQHLIDPEICIRCNTCESRCSTGAISHGKNYVVDPAVCTYCMRCVKPCPTGAIDNWFVVDRPYPLAEQHVWDMLPARPAEVAGAVPDAFDDEATRILEIAHRGLRGPAKAPASASKPRINAFTREAPARATVVGNTRITAEGSASDVHHIILDFGAEPFPYRAPHRAQPQRLRHRRNHRARHRLRRLYRDHPEGHGDRRRDPGQNGYVTAWIGKNHNTPIYETSAVGPFDHWPNGLGFDYFYGFMAGDTNQLRPYLFENQTPSGRRPPTTTT